MIRDSEREHHSSSHGRSLRRQQTPQEEHEHPRGRSRTCSADPDNHKSSKRRSLSRSRSRAHSQTPQKAHYLATHQTPKQRQGNMTVFADEESTTVGSALSVKDQFEIIVPIRPQQRKQSRAKPRREWRLFGSGASGHDHDDHTSVSSMSSSYVRYIPPDQRQLSPLSEERTDTTDGEHASTIASSTGVVDNDTTRATAAWCCCTAPNESVHSSENTLISTSRKNDTKLKSSSQALAKLHHRPEERSSRTPFKEEARDQPESSPPSTFAMLVGLLGCAPAQGEVNAALERQKQEEFGQPQEEPEKAEQEVRDQRRDMDLRTERSLFDDLSEGADPDAYHRGNADSSGRNRRKRSWKAIRKNLPWRRRSPSS